MGLFDKIKNMFTEEVEDDDVKVEKIKKEVTHVAIESPKIEQEKEYEDEMEAPVIEPLHESKPIFFDDNDFRDLNLTGKPKHESKTEVEEKELYGSKITEDNEIKEEKKIFKPTPIISPVYGILDKNYHKEDIVSRNESKNENIAKESPIDSIRNKAYGTLEDELENTLFGSNSILFKKEESSNDKQLEIKEVDDEALTDLTDDISKELDELLVKKEKQIEEIEKNKSEEQIKKEDTVEDEDLLGFIDSTLYKDGDE